MKGGRKLNGRVDKPRRGERSGEYRSRSRVTSLTLIRTLSRSNTLKSRALARWMLCPEAIRRAGIVQADTSHQHLAGSFRPLAGMVLSGSRVSSGRFWMMLGLPVGLRRRRLGLRRTRRETKRYRKRRGQRHQKACLKISKLARTAGEDRVSKDTTAD